MYTIAHGSHSKHTVGESEAALVQNAEVKQLKYKTVMLIFQST